MTPSTEEVAEIRGINTEKTAWHHIRNLSMTSPIIYNGLNLGKAHGWGNELTLLNMVLTMNSVITEQQNELNRIHETSVIRIVKLDDARMVIEDSTDGI